MLQKIFDFGDLDSVGDWDDDDDTPPEPGGAVDPEAIPAEEFHDRIALSRARRAQQIRRELRISEPFPDRFPEAKIGRPCKNR